MTISDLINQLMEVKCEHGDLPVLVHNNDLPWSEVKEASELNVVRALRSAFAASDDGLLTYPAESSGGSPALVLQ